LLAGIGETSTSGSMSHVVVYEIDQPSFAPCCWTLPEMAEDLPAILGSVLNHRFADAFECDSLRVCGGDPWRMSSG
jgi:hypothetical protein